MVRALQRAWLIVMSDPLHLEPGLPAMPEPEGGVREVVPQRRLARLLAFAGRSIDDVVNCRIAKREVAHYFKTAREVLRRTDRLELERQWNPLGRPG